MNKELTLLGVLNELENSSDPYDNALGEALRAKIREQLEAVATEINGGQTTYGMLKPQ